MLKCPCTPVYTKYRALTEAKLLKLAYSPDGIERDKDGKINTVFFYSDATNLQTYPQHWDTYFEKVKLLAKLGGSKVTPVLHEVI